MKDHPASIGMTFKMLSHQQLLAFWTGITATKSVAIQSHTLIEIHPIMEIKPTLHPIVQVQSSIT